MQFSKIISVSVNMQNTLIPAGDFCLKAIVFQVLIVVGDINDNAPEFPNPVSQLTFSEGSVPGTRVILDSAVDRDKGENGKVSDYRIRSGNEDGKFRLSLSNNPDNKVRLLKLPGCLSLVCR